MAKLETIFSLLGHYKYLITIVLGLLIVCVLSDNSFMNLMKLDMQKSDLQAEIKKYNKQHDDAARELVSLKHSRNAVEKVARERYFMKKDDEEVFVLSTDIPTVEEENYQ